MSERMTKFNESLMKRLPQLYRELEHIEKKIKEGYQDPEFLASEVLRITYEIGQHAICGYYKYVIKPDLQGEESLALIRGNWQTKEDANHAR